ncbi:branched-chain alpha-ketoacid dehydrogenase [Cantharellus anzutake]|uniref:uncharacterized protein n=1 Tax=Cantharellus anzutake TaxID=1750568 RepID=UPI0019074E1A|nr:uncharacterized protein EI90DRAFT_3147813 [Cantharellus anzutake]XP_038918511.1 branched-chain alpha-ketoacid dehydrogenase [Cantharellus anzutake]KAF8312561.1 hypothetical protein EI90DRAFT_3147813 [Cantharellus anzutake]KAF8335083.1 branched-chain alpha-ketoacid dehydrogenase [Cantharellus anzutake]
MRSHHTLKLLQRPKSPLACVHWIGERASHSTSSWEVNPPSDPGLQFYRNRQLELFAGRETKRLSLRQLVFFGRAMDPERLLKSANYVRQELPVRLAHRIRDMQALPFVVVTQDSVAQVYELYWDAFERFRRFPPVNDLSQNEKFCALLRTLLDAHAGVIPRLSLGLSLSSHHLSPDHLDSFMRRMLVSRISRRVLAEHHIALTESLEGSTSENSRMGSPPGDHVGIIYTNLSVRNSIDHCVSLLRNVHEAEVANVDNVIDFPDVIVDGHIDARFSYIKEHLDYVIFELLNNAIRATRTFKYPSDRESRQRNVRVTIVASTDDISLRISDNGGGLSTPDPTSLYSFSHLRNAARLESERLGALRDAVDASSHLKRGIVGTIGEQLKRLLPVDKAAQILAQHGGLGAAGLGTGATEAKRLESSHDRGRERIGLGLPMSNIYATYFGGSLSLTSLDGWGTDVYLRLPKLGTNLEGVEV